MLWVGFHDSGVLGRPATFEEFDMKRLILCAAVLLFGVGQTQAELVAHWKLDGNGDDSANGHGGTVNGATPTEDRFGNANGALLFDGSNDYIDVSHHADLTPANAMTISAWFKPNSFNLGTMSWPAILKKVSDAGMSGYSMEIGQVWEGTPKVDVIVNSAAGNESTHNAYPVGIDTWYFLAGVYEYDSNADESTLTTFCGSDSQSLQSRATTFDGPLMHSDANLNIGRDNYLTGSSRHFNGIIDDVRIYNEALTSEQVNALYTIPEPSTVALLAMAAVGLAVGLYRRKV